MTDRAVILHSAPFVSRSPRPLPLRAHPNQNAASKHGNLNTPTMRFTGHAISGLHWFASATTCQVTRLHLTDMTRFPQPPARRLYLAAAVK